MDFTNEQADKVKNFLWNDNEEDENAKPQPQMSVCNEMLECAERVSEYVVNNIDFCDLQHPVYSVTIPVEIHPLLADRFDNQWTEYSRSRVFDFLRAVFVQKMADLGYVDQLESKVREIFPRKNALIRISDIDFYDEPEVDVSVTNKQWNPAEDTEEVQKKRSYNYSGNTITVELKIDIVDSTEGSLPDFVV